VWSNGLRQGQVAQEEFAGQVMVLPIMAKQFGLRPLHVEFVLDSRLGANRIPARFSEKIHEMSVTQAVLVVGGKVVPTPLLRIIEEEVRRADRLVGMRIMVGIVDPGGNVTAGNDYPPEFAKDCLDVVLRDMFQRIGRDGHVEPAVGVIGSPHVDRREIPDSIPRLEFVQVAHRPSVNRHAERGNLLNGLIHLVKVDHRIEVHTGLLNPHVRKIDVLGERLAGAKLNHPLGTMFGDIFFVEALVGADPPIFTLDRPVTYFSTA